MAGKSPDLAEIKQIVDSIESTISKPDAIIASKLKKFRDSTNPVDRAISRLELKKQGLTPMEVNQLIDDTSIQLAPPLVTSGSEFLLKSFGASKWVYPGLLPSGVVTILSGQAGSGKTAFAYNMMFSYLSNNPFLSEDMSYPSLREAKRGLIINSDQPPSDAQEMLRSSPDTFNDMVRFDIIEHSWNLSYLIELEKLIQSKGYTFIIIDSYKSIHSHVPDWDENAPYAGTGIRELQRVASTYGVTILVIHHAGHNERKGGHQARGHSSIPDAASCVMSISSAPMDRNKTSADPNIRFLEISKIRNAERAQVTIAFNATNYRYELCLDNEGQKRNQLASMCTRILPEFYCNKLGGVSSESVMNKLAKTSEQKMFIHRAIRKLEMRGIIEKSISQAGTTGVTYSIVEYVKY
jgi:archaellum biogenesis ATPase FlaH